MGQPGAGREMIRRHAARVCSEPVQANTPSTVMKSTQRHTLAVNVSMATSEAPTP